MRIPRIKHFVSLLAGAAMFVTGVGFGTAETAPGATVPVTMTVTASVAGNKRMPEITGGDVVIRQGKSQLAVTNWVPARGDRAGLELFILIDDAADSLVSLQYDDLRAFINAQPATTLVGVGYMRNATVQIAQDLTLNHDMASQALRIPLGNPGAFGSPYLSVADLMKRWPVDQNRREVIMITDGVGRERRHLGWHRGYRHDPDVEAASALAQRTDTNIFAIYTPGSNRFHRGYWDVINGQMNMTRLSDRTGGASFYLGLHGPVSIQPYLAQLQTILDNQYLLSFSANPGRRPGFQTIDLSTEVAGVNLVAHDAVWVAGGK